MSFLLLSSPSGDFMTHAAINGEYMIELNGAPFGTMTQTYVGDSLNTAVHLASCSDENIGFVA